MLPMKGASIVGRITCKQTWIFASGSHPYDSLTEFACAPWHDVPPLAGFRTAPSLQGPIGEH